MVFFGKYLFVANYRCALRNGGDAYRPARRVKEKESVDLSEGEPAKEDSKT